jgi:hypothetical protein
MHLTSDIQVVIRGNVLPRGRDYTVVYLKEMTKSSLDEEFRKIHAGLFNADWTYRIDRENKNGVIISDCGGAFGFSGPQVIGTFTWGIPEKEFSEVLP